MPNPDNSLRCRALERHRICWDLFDQRCRLVQRPLHFLRQLSTETPVQGALPAALRFAQKYGLTGGTEVLSVLGEASNNALLVGYERIAEPKYVVGAGLLLSLTSAVRLLRARDGRRRPEDTSGAPPL